MNLQEVAWLEAFPRHLISLSHTHFHCCFEEQLYTVVGEYGSVAMLC